MLHCLVAHKIFLDAKSVIALLKLTLYAQLDVVDECVSKPARNRGKEDLEKMTVELHYISRMINPLIANADMTATIMREMKTSHDRYCDSQPGANTSNAAIKTSDSIRYLLESAVSQKRWLVSYKSRKDVTLNLQHANARRRRVVAIRGYGCTFDNYRCRLLVALAFRATSFQATGTKVAQGEGRRANGLSESRFVTHHPPFQK
jgi:hypothetical protein